MKEKHISKAVINCLIIVLVIIRATIFPISIYCFCLSSSPSWYNNNIKPWSPEVANDLPWKVGGRARRYENGTVLVWMEHVHKEVTSVHVYKTHQVWTTIRSLVSHNSTKITGEAVENIATIIWTKMYNIMKMMYNFWTTWKRSLSVAITAKQLVYLFCTWSEKLFSECSESLEFRIAPQPVKTICSIVDHRKKKKRLHNVPATTKAIQICLRRLRWEAIWYHQNVSFYG